MYRVYSGPAGSKTLSPLDKGRHLFKECASMDEAVSFAQHLKATGRVALLIEGDDGTHLDRSALAKTLHHRDSEQVHGAAEATDTACAFARPRRTGLRNLNLHRMPPAK